jgi:hypothetical protein
VRPDFPLSAGASLRRLSAELGQRQRGQRRAQGAAFAASSPLEHASLVKVISFAAEQRTAEDLAGAEGPS